MDINRLPFSHRENRSLSFVRLLTCPSLLFTHNPRHNIAVKSDSKNRIGLGALRKSSVSLFYYF
jgi:hypothetical protein